jgi:uncharacterized protein with FMN-binding domain
MRRLLLALVSTAAGLAAVLSFKTHSSAAASDVAAPATGAQSGTSGTSGTSAGSAAGTAAGSGTAAPKGGTGTGTGTAAAGTRTLTGTVDNTQYGPMQVEVMLQGRKITDVKVLQQTDTGTMSQQIDANAIPQLTRETLMAQSARIDAVSGASYTSAGYIKSLQSALDKA